MVSPFDDMIDFIEDFQKKVDEKVIDLSRQYEPEIVDHITDNQLFKGKDSEGNDIEPSYTPFTISIKRSKGQPTNRVTLKDEGDFHNSIELDFSKDQYVVYATDSKTKRLERKYGNKILGLNDEGIQLNIDLVKPDLINDFRKIIE